MCNIRRFYKFGNGKFQEESHHTTFYSWMSLRSRKGVGLNSPICNVQSNIGLRFTEVGLADHLVLMQIFR